MGWTGGYLLLAVFLGPYLRQFGAYTIPDFLGARYGGNLPASLAWWRQLPARSPISLPR